MWISAKIRQHVFNLPENEPFATRDLLEYGPRDAVDKAIQRLLKDEVIMRVARGIFVKPVYEMGVLKLPTLAQIAQTKARAFGRRLSSAGADALAVIESDNQEPAFVSSGSSSSFLCRSADFGQVRVHFRCASALAKRGGDSALGLNRIESELAELSRAMRSLSGMLCNPALLAHSAAPFAFGQNLRKDFKAVANGCHHGSRDSSGEKQPTSGDNICCR